MSNLDPTIDSIARFVAIVDDEKRKSSARGFVGGFVVGALFGLLVRWML